MPIRADKEDEFLKLCYNFPQDMPLGHPFQYLTKYHDGTESGAKKVATLFAVIQRWMTVLDEDIEENSLQPVEAVLHLTMQLDQGSKVLDDNMASGKDPVRFINDKYSEGVFRETLGKCLLQFWDQGEDEDVAEFVYAEIFPKAEECCKIVHEFRESMKAPEAHICHVSDMPKINFN